MSTTPTGGKVARHTSRSTSIRGSANRACRTTGAPVVRHARLADPRMAVLRLVCLATFPPVGVVLIAVSYRQSLLGAGTSYFGWFWLGMLAGYGPLVTWMCARHAPRWQRQAAVAALALFT